jgi:hypothetical protein
MVELIEAESGMVVTRGWGKLEGEMLSKGYKISVR